MSPELSPSHTSASGPASGVGSLDQGGPGADLSALMSTHGHKAANPVSVVGQAPQDGAAMGQLPGGVAGETKIAKMACNEAHPQNDFGHKVPSQSIAPKVENQVEPGKDAKTAAPDMSAKAVAEPAKEPERGGVMGAFDSVKDFVAEHPIIASVAAAAAVYALQSAFSAGGGSLLTAGLVGTATAMMGGVMDSKADKEKEKKGEFNLGITDAMFPVKGLYKAGKTLMTKLSGPSADAAGSGGTDAAQKLLEAAKGPAGGGPAKS